MVDAGKVTFHVDIDARDLSAKLTAAVHEAVRPALASLQRDLAGSLSKVGGRNRGGTTNYGAATADLDRHVKKLQQYHGVLGQVNLMWDRFLARMVIAGSLISSIAPIIGVLGGAVGVLGGGIGALVGGLGALGAGMMALIPAIVGIVGAIKIGFAGLKEGAKAYMAQFDDANKVIAAQIGNMMGPMLTAWQQVSARIKLDFASTLVPAFNNLGALIRAIGPALSQVGQAFGAVANNVTAGLLAAAPQINTILEGSKQLLTAIGPGIQTLTKGMLDLGASAQKAMPMIGAAITSALSQVGASMSQMAASPVFQQALAGFGQIIAQIGGLLANLVPVLIQIGATAGPVFAQMIGALGPSLNTLLNAFGQLATTVGPIFNQFLAGLGPVLAQVVLGLGRMGEIVGPTLIPLLQGLADALEPLYEPLAQLGKILSEQLANILPTIGQGLAALVGPIAQALPTLGTLINVLAQLVVAAGPALIGLAQGVGAISQGLIAGLQPMIPVINQLATVLGPILLKIGESVGQVLAALGPPLAALISALTPVADMLGNVIVVAVKALADVITAAAPFLTQFFQMLADAMVTVAPQFNAFITQVGQQFTSLVQQAMPMLQAAFDQLKPSLGRIIQSFADMLPLLLEIIPQLLQLGLTLLQELLPYLPQLLEGFIKINEIGLKGLAIALPLLELPLKAFAAGLGALVTVAEQVGTAFETMKEAIAGPINWMIDQYNSKIKPVLDAMRVINPLMPAPPTIGHIDTGPAYRGGGGGFGAPPPGRPGAPLVHTPMTPIPGQLGNAAGARVGGTGGMSWAAPGPSTPVAPDLGKGKGADKPISPDDLPLDVVAKTPEQIKILTDIRALLAGTGNTSAPLNTLKDMGPAVQTIATDLKKTLPENRLPPGSVPGRMGPFGTPIPARHPGYEAAAAAIQALGGKPEQWIGTNPIDYATQQWGDQVDTWKTQMDQRIQAWQDSLKQAGQPPLSPGQMAALPGMPSGWTPTNLPAGQQGSLTAALQAQGVSPQMMRLILAFSQVEGNNPAGLPTLGFRDDQLGGAADMQSRVGALMRQFQARAGVAGPFPQGGTDQQQAEWIARVVGQAGVAGQPADYVQRVVAAMGGPAAPGIPGMPAAPGMPTAPGLPGPNLATSGSPVPVWVVGSGPLGSAGLSAAATVGALPAGGAGLVSDTGPVPTSPAGLAIANAVKHWFPQVGTIGGSRPVGTSTPNTHDTGTSIDIPITDPAMGDQINQYLQQNAQQMGILYTIWRDKGVNAVGNPSGGAGSTFTTPGHQDHIDVHFGGGAGVTGMPTAPGLPGPNLATAGSAVPVFVTNWPGQTQGGAMPGANILGAGINAAGQAGANVAGDIVSAAGSVGTEPWVNRKPNADLSQLVQEGNPLALANMAGFNVQDFTRQGGIPPANIAPPGPAYDASGRLFSDAAGMIDRSFTSLTAQIEAMRAQLLDVLNQVRDRVSEDVLRPIIQAAINSAMQELSSKTTGAIGESMGQAAAKPIADAVSAAVPQSGSTGVGQIVSQAGSTFNAAVFDTGGPWPTGTAGLNLSGGTEYVLTADEYRRFGPPSAAFATKAGVIGNETVGAEFFGVSQIPIIGMIINLLVRVLLTIIGVNIEVRDTMNELTGQFRQFRGDAFKAFNAQGRLISDTSGLIDRSLSSEKAAADERIRILKVVLQALVKYIIEKIIVPIVKAVANAAIQATSAAASSAMNSVSFGAGSVVGALISSGGQAAVEIAGDLASDFYSALSQVLIDVVSSGLQSVFPDLMTGIFSGSWMQIFAAPAGNFLGNLFGGMANALAGAIGGGLTGGIAAMIGGLLGGAALGTNAGGFFDSGGLAVGQGLIPKGVTGGELILSPAETNAFDRLVAALERGTLGSRQIEINAPFTVVGGAAGGEQAHDRLLELLS